MRKDCAAYATSACTKPSYTPQRLRNQFDSLREGPRGTTPGIIQLPDDLKGARFGDLAQRSKKHLMCRSARTLYSGFRNSFRSALLFPIWAIPQPPALCLLSALRHRALVIYLLI